MDGATNNVSLPEDAAAMQLMQLSLVDQGAWFTTSITTYTLLFSLASVTFGVGAFTFVLGMPAAIFFYLLFERKRFGHQYGIEPSLVPQSLIVYAICTILTFWIKGSTRQQFLVRIYVQHERDARVEQLEQRRSASTMSGASRCKILTGRSRHAVPRCSRHAVLRCTSRRPRAAESRARARGRRRRGSSR